MANITAADVKKLRDQTGAGMMECKAALTEANGNFEEANLILRKRGLASAAKKAGRATSEGLIGHRVSADHRSGILVEVNCESDFVARTPDFQQLVEDVIDEIERAGDAATDELARGSRTARFRSAWRPASRSSAKTWRVRRFVRFAGQGPASYVGQYIHMGGKIGVQVEFSGVDPTLAGRDEFVTLVKEIAMQIAAASPAYVTRAAVPGGHPRPGEIHLPGADGRLRASRRKSSTRSSKASSAASTRRSCCPIRHPFAIRR